LICEGRRFVCCRALSGTFQPPQLIIQPPSTMVELKGEQDAEGREDDEI
jgi:hypothetical protein